MNPDPTWNQRWRTGLRTALNGLRDGLAVAYEVAAAPLLTDPWAARDAYVDVVEDAGLDVATTDAFFAARARHPLTGPERQLALRLLEMQRCALLMFTSCGWFFDDVSGQESVILLRYAARGLSLLAECDGDGAHRLERRFLDDLTHAESNVRHNDGRVRTGRDIFLEYARPAAIGPDRVAVSLALTCATGAPAPARVAVWRVVEHEEAALDDKSLPCVVGRVGLLEQRVETHTAQAFAVVDFGGIDQRGVLVPPEMLEGLRADLAAATDASALARVLDEATRAGGRGFSLRDAPADLRDAIAQRALARRVDVTDAVLAELLLSERSLLRGVVAMGGVLPTPVKGLLAHALSRRARDVVAELVGTEGSTAPAIRRLRTVVTDAAGFGVVLELDETVRSLEGAVATQVVRLLGELADDASLHRVTRLCGVLETIADDRPLLRLLKAASALSTAARLDRHQQVARTLLPVLNRVCHAAFPVPD